MQWWKRRNWERRMDAEFRFHVESLIKDNLSRGLSRKEAEASARREFGALELAKDECRDERPSAWFDHFRRDVRYAARSLRKSPGFAIAAVATLALGIGANTAIFQLLDAVRLRTLPVEDPHRLASVQLADTKGWRGSQASPYPALTNPLWEQFRDSQTTFSGVLAWGDNGFNLSPGGEARLARGLFVSGEFFRVLGVAPLMGRVFTAADDRRGCGLPGGVISYAFWQRELGGDPGAIGRKLTLNFQPVEVIGVTGPGFSGLEIGHSYDVAVPICSQAALWNEGNWLNAGTVWWLNVMGRLKPEISLEKAAAQLQVISPGIFQAALPANYPAVNVKDYLQFKLTALPAATGVSRLRSQYGNPLLLLLATSGLVLLIACANLANLILARATTREHEFAVRLAIGASRGRLIRQLMVESVMLALGGAAAGLLLSGLLSAFLVKLLGTEGNRLFLDLQPDGRMLAFTMAVASLTCILFGVTPALRATRVAASDAMKAGGRTFGASRERFELRQVLVVSQVALSLVLLVGALLFSGSLRNLLTVDAGFQHRGVAIANLDFSRPKMPPARRIAFKHEVLTAIRSVPGVASAAEVAVLPLTGSSSRNGVWKEGANPDSKVDCNFNWVGDGYLKTMEIPLLAGRAFSERDTVQSPRVAMVNQEFARQLGLGANPVGERFHRDATPSLPETAYEIVGLVRDTKYLDLREEFQPIAFLSIDQDNDPGPFAQLLLRSTLAPREAIATVRAAIGGVSPTIGMQFQWLEARVEEGLMRERLMATLSNFFGVVAALMAAIGLYGVMSYLVVRRTNEIGVRIALGAGRGSIMGLVLRQAGILLAAGAGAGILLSLAIAGAAESILFGLKSNDLPTLLLATGLLGVVAAAASYLPARRAARLEPMAALREE